MNQNSSSPQPSGRPTSTYPDEIKNHPCLVHRQTPAAPLPGEFRTSARFVTCRGQYSTPGWVKFLEDQGNLHNDSMLTLWLDRAYLKWPPRIIGNLSAEELNGHRQYLRDMLSGVGKGEPRFYSSLMNRLRPHDPTGRNLPRSGAINLLYPAGWVPLQRGAVFTLPPWHPAAGNRVLVISNSRFNNSFTFPEMVIVRLVSPSSAHGVDHPVSLDVVDGLPEAAIADCSTAMTLSFSKNWLARCLRCFDPKSHPEHLLVPAGEYQGKCLRCDGVMNLNLWPLIETCLHRPSVDRVAKTVLDLLGC